MLRTVICFCFFIILAFVYSRRIPSAPPPKATFRQLPGPPRHLKIVVHPKTPLIY